MTRKAAALVLALALALVAGLGVYALGQGMASRRAEALAEPFKGVTTDGDIVPGLFSVQATGVTTEPVKQAAEAFLQTLTAEQTAKTRYAADDIEWRKWDNVHRAPREGIRFGEMNDAQRRAAFDLLGAALSAKGLEKARNVMRLNQHLAELISSFEEYGEGLYFITVMGEPSLTEPWGFQLDGHHLAINYFILGDQVVMSPAFMGSEPVIARSGKYEGTAVMQDEQNKGLAFMDSLDAAQKKIAILDVEKTRGNALAQAYNDNLVLDYAGLPATELDASQREKLLGVIEEYVGNLSDGHAAIRMREIKEHLDETYFGWIGDTGPDSVFYYRIHSPVVLIEFDHQGPVALDRTSQTPTRRHVHSVMRTPNGNDYGKDLLRQHYEAHKHDTTHGHVH